MLDSCCYSRRLPAIQQQQEQHTHPRGGQDSRQGSQREQRKQNLVSQSPVNIGCTSKTFSMGPEPDSEVKRLPDLSVKTASTPLPPLDYLDVCDSSFRSFVDGSQLSADEDSAASTWYAELNVSGQSESDEDSLSHLQLADLPDNDDHGGECSGAGEFECVDVALESGEEAGNGLGPKTVPKRQIQLRRCSTEGSLAASGGLEAGPAPQCHGQPKAVLYRQYSTPTTIQGGSYRACAKSSPGNRKQKLQKSISLDETSSRTKMASSLIKNVLSKKMQVELKIQQQKPVEVDFSLCSPVTETLKTRVDNARHPGPHRGRSRSHDGLPGQAKLDPQGGLVQHGNVSAKTHQKLPSEHSISALQSAGGRPAESYNGGAGRSNPQLSRRENPMEQKEPLDSRTGERELCSGDTAKAGTGNAASLWAGVAGRAEGECQVSPGNSKQRIAASNFPPKPPQIALAPRIQEERRGSGDYLPKNVEIGVGAEAVKPPADRVLEARGIFGGTGEIGNRENSERGQTVAPLHRVRDMRKLVKSTYSSSFNFNANSGEKQPGKKVIVPPQLSAQTPPDGAKETGATSNSPAIKSGAAVMSRDKTIAVPSVLELGTREARVPPNVQRPLAKVTSDKKPTVTSSYNQMTMPSYLLRASTPPMSSYKNQPAVSAYKQQQASSATVAAPTHSCLPTETATPSYKMPRRDLTCCPSEGAPVGGMRENFSLPPTRSQDPPAALPSMTYQTASFNTKNLDSMKTLALPICPTQLLLPQSKDTVHSQGQGTLQNSAPDHSELTRSQLERGRSRSPHRAPPEAQLPYPCGPGGPTATFAAELGGQAGKAPYLPGGGGLVFGQNPRRLLLDPETGTCFYVEMPAQPRRKVLFDPESGQYMEVLVPPQALYPPSLNPCPYPYLPAPSVYPHQYLPYSVLSLSQGP